MYVIDKDSAALFIDIVPFLINFFILTLFPDFCEVLILEILGDFFDDSLNL